MHPILFRKQNRLNRANRRTLHWRSPCFRHGDSYDGLLVDESGPSIITRPSSNVIKLDGDRLASRETVSFHGPAWLVSVYPLRLRRLSMYLIVAVSRKCCRQHFLQLAGYACSADFRRSTLNVYMEGYVLATKTGWWVNLYWVPAIWAEAPPNSYLSMKCADVVGSWCVRNMNQFISRRFPVWRKINWMNGSFYWLNIWESSLIFCADAWKCARVLLRLYRYGSLLLLDIWYFHFDIEWYFIHFKSIGNSNYSGN